VTARILQDAISRHAESQEVLIHGVEAAIVHLVGTVEGLVAQSATIEFQLNDASGRMKVRYYGSSGSMETVAAGLAAGRYVSIVGNLRTSPVPHISAMTLKPVASADEISFHMIEVAHAALRLRNPTTAAPAAITPAKAPGLGLGFNASGATTTPMKVEMPVARVAEPVKETVAPLKSLDLRGSIMEMLKQAQDAGSAEGVGIPAFQTRVAPTLAAPSEKIKEVLLQLVDEGEAYSTIDDDHFSLL
jgi:hypothetical protein